MTRITTHVLDLVSGRPAAGLVVRLHRLGAAEPEPMARAAADQDGRVHDWLPDGVRAGTYQLVFETGAWHRAAGLDTLYPEIAIQIALQDGEPLCHIPLLLAPFGYTTYRGS